MRLSQKVPLSIWRPEPGEKNVESKIESKVESKVESNVKSRSESKVESKTETSNGRKITRIAPTLMIFTDLIATMKPFISEMFTSSKFFARTENFRLALSPLAAKKHFTSTHRRQFLRQPHMENEKGYMNLTQMLLLLLKPLLLLLLLLLF